MPTGSVPSGSQPGSPPSGGGSSRRPMLLIGGAAVAVLLVAGVVGASLLGDKDDEKTSTKPQVSATAVAAPVDVKSFTVSSYDPKPNGEGFRDKGDFWDTNIYADSNFGGLKPGVGLVLDLGSAKQVASVTFKAQTGPLTVQLRSADDKPVGKSSGKAVGGTVQADGKTKLTASNGGKHQYWMIWVTNLGPTKKAIISNISVLASPTS
jgi:hypothetical protein